MKRRGEIGISIFDLGHLRKLSHFLPGKDNSNATTEDASTTPGNVITTMIAATEVMKAKIVRIISGLASPRLSLLVRTQNVSLKHTNVTERMTVEMVAMSLDVVSYTSIVP